MGGQTSCELTRVGINTIGVCKVENQLGNIKGWEKIGFLEYAGWYSKGNIVEKIKNAIERLKDTKERKNKIKTAKKYIDGKVSLKIIDRIMKKLL